MVLKIAKDATDVFVQTEEVKKPEIDAQLVSESIAEQLERRAHFRKAMKRAIGQAMKSGAEGIKVQTLISANHAVVLVGRDFLYTIRNTCLSSPSV